MPARTSGAGRHMACIEQGTVPPPLAFRRHATCKKPQVPRRWNTVKASHPLHRASHAPPHDRGYLAERSAGGKEKDKSIIGQYPPLHPTFVRERQGNTYKCLHMQANGNAWEILLTSGCIEKQNLESNSKHGEGVMPLAKRPQGARRWTGISARNICWRIRTGTGSG